MAPLPASQELEEHYFGAIRPTVSAYMKDLDDELWALGIPAKTKHNEVAPCQHELAPVYGEVNEAIDQNLVMMEKMKLIASRHDLVCLLHEKPFEGINGSGKHNNWSLGTESENLLDPGDTPLDNLQFIVFLTAVIEPSITIRSSCVPPLPRPATIIVWAPTRLLRRLCPSSWATSLPRSSRRSSMAKLPSMPRAACSTWAPIPCPS